MKIFISITILLIFSSVKAESNLDPITLNPARQSTQLIFLLDHLKKHLIDLKRQKQIHQSLKTLNKNLEKVSYENYVLFVDTEFSKAILNFYGQEKTVDVSGNQLILMQNILKDKRDQYSSLGIFLMERVLKDYAPYLASQMIYNYKNPKYQIQKNLKQIKRIEVLNKYLGSLVKVFVQLGPERINDHLNRLSAYCLESLERASFAFHHAAMHKQGEIVATLTGLENVKFQEKPTEINQAPTPEKAIEEISTDEDPSVKIDELIEDVEPNKN